MSLKISKDIVSKMLKSMESLTLNRVLVGIPESAADRPDDAAADNALIGHVMEYGSPINNVPARPTLVPGVQAVEPQTIERFRKAALAAMLADSAGVNRQLQSAGMEAAASVKRTINSNVPPELAESTLEARRARGVTRTTTLVDTGEYRNSITYVVRGK